MDVGLQQLKPLPVTIQYHGQKEDVERTIRYFERDGKVVRYNKITMLTKYYGTTGGGLGNFKSRMQISRDVCLRLKEAILTTAPCRQERMA